MASRFFAQSWGSRKSHALVKVQAKLLSQRHWKIQWLRWDCLFLFLRTVSTRQVGGAAHPTSFYFVVLIFIPTSASQPMEKASNSFWKLWLGICTQNFHPCPSLWNSVTWPVQAAWEPRKYHPQLGIHLPCSSVYMCCGIILLLQGRRLYWPTEENEQCQCQHKTLFLIVAPLIMCKGQRNLFEPQFYPPENHISQSHYPQQLRREWKWEPKSSRLAPGSVESVLPVRSRGLRQAHPAPQSHRPCLEGGPTVDLLLTLAAIPGAPCSFSWISLLLPPLLQWKDFADWWTVTWKVEADPRSLCS